MTAMQKERRRAWERDRKLRLIAARICYKCNQPLPDGWPHTRCQRCREIGNARRRELYEYRKMSGACQWCGRIAREGMVLCWDCSLKKSRMGAERRAAEKAAREKSEAENGEFT